MRIEEHNTETVEAPSARVILKASAIAFVVALLILLVAVLPAEYGIDPLRTGKALGLIGLSKAASTEPSGRAVPVQSGIYTVQPRIYKVDSEDFSLQPGEGVEMKYHLQKGAGMVYGWRANAKLTFEFHGEPDQKPNKDYFDSYELDDKVGKSASFGSFTAPSTGIHGWFWQNRGDKEVTFHLTVAGFFDSATMFVDGKPDNIPVEDAK